MCAGLNAGSNLGASQACAIRIAPPTYCIAANDIACPAMETH
ncbi:hypothetical protein K788_0000267 [Paraburkholderia caribensis MBA4]|uniref:Uncharacterized protein n=1 Tax=Paraburkholderia caribensis MBA4 TaxID=1323664 RepID=A0A0P0RJ76_9BURK|nr:hypothetical protein K788_0000267 [Paraburkholderia caribensis MBA4]